VFIVVRVYFVNDSVRKLLDTPSQIFRSSFIGIRLIILRAIQIYRFSSSRCILISSVHLSFSLPSVIFVCGGQGKDKVVPVF